MNAGNMLYASPQQRYSPWSFEFEGLNYASPWPWQMYWFYQQQQQANYCHPSYQVQPTYRPLQTIPLPPTSDTSDSEGEPHTTARITPATPERDRTSTTTQDISRRDNSRPKKKNAKKKPQLAPLTLSPASPAKSEVTRLTEMDSPSPKSMVPMIPGLSYSEQCSLLRNASLSSSVGSPGRRGREFARPSHWREDYVPPSSPWIKKRFLQLRSIVKASDEILPTTLLARSQPITLNPLLQYHCPLLSTSLLSPSHTSYAYFFDLRQDALSDSSIHLPASNGPVNALHHLQLATTPPTHHLTLMHPLLPWTLTVRSSHPNGVLVSDVLRCMYDELMKPISREDWWNAEMEAEDREAVEDAYRRRCKTDVKLLMEGVKRVDWLGDSVGFIGLAPVKVNGMWEIKTVPVLDSDV
ncbi:hypothetical protein CC1G_08500 [Coprinopsis cinerea okayama7|uniref:DUF6699 domain-containing protein n=1 Tax=Coprinopsis cinerea (strain Okayama-7 / 130 / ATCC MYA-4618 / FGSC 9003) TaxID=240176 RepID=A8ND06_COPC7|nr:hypothetical protein CC1G_08500 [Coprinopsis cinerea okayama7\|eukprot:XP_001832672.1 hypothetical protein CC1G_08500 [Coprinopsis cinerea okayama7\